MMTTTPKTTTPDLRSMLASIAERARREEAEARAQRLEAERALRFARGTRDVTKQAEAARTPQTIGEKIEAVLRGPFAPHNIREIATSIGESTSRVQTCLKKLRNTPCPTRSRDDAPDAKQIYNLGSNDDPFWIWVIGDETSAEELHEMVRKLITYKPMTFAELTLATGARRGRLSGRLVQMQRDGEKLVDARKDKSERSPYEWHLRSRKRR